MTPTPKRIAGFRAARDAETMFAILGAVMSAFCHGFPLRVGQYIEHIVALACMVLVLSRVAH
jgi:hypothetical protein